MAVAASHIALDGSRVSIAARNLDLSRQATSLVTALVGKQRARQEFLAGTRSFGESLVVKIHGLVLTEQYALQHGVLRIGSGISRGSDSAVLAAVWEGGGSSLLTLLHGPSRTAADAVDLFSLFDLNENAAAVTLRPRDLQQAAFEDTPILLKEVPDLGLLEASKLTPSRARDLPNWRGTPVVGGELFSTDVGLPSMHFVLVAQNSVTRILPTAAATTNSATIEELAQLSVDWAAASQ